MEIKYSSFRKQLMECYKTGNVFEVKCINCSQINFICHKYKAMCSSKVCRDERIVEISNE